MFSERLKLARERYGLSLRSLSLRLGGLVSARAIGKYERGELLPNSTVVIALAKALDVSVFCWRLAGAATWVQRRW